MTPETWTLEDGMIGLLVGAMRADGQDHREEMRAATLHLEAMAPVVNVGMPDVLKRVDPMGRVLDDVGAIAFVERCVSAIPGDLRLAAFRALVDVVTADHAVTKAEIEYLHLASGRLGVPAEAVASILPRADAPA